MRIFLPVIALLTAPYPAEAREIPSDVLMSLQFLASEVTQAYPNGNNLPKEFKRHPKAVREAADSHLKLMAAVAKAAGLSVKRVDGYLEVASDDRSEVGKEISRLSRLGVKSFQYDPVYLTNYSLVAAYDPIQKKIFMTTASMATGKMDSTLHHEAVHARNDLDPAAIRSDLRLTFRSTSKPDLRNNAIIYPRFLTADEASAYTAELAFMLNIPSAVNDVDPASNLTPFQNKASLMLEVVKTLVAVTEPSAIANPKIESKPGLLKVRFKTFDVELTACQGPCDARGETVWLADISDRLKVLRARALKLQASLENDSLSPAALVREPSAALAD